MNDAEKQIWLMGFFEGQVSFSVNIALSSTKNKRYVFFKPNIIISNSDEAQLKFIVDYLKLGTAITEKKKRDTSHNTCHTLNIQDLGDIAIILQMLSGKEFVSKLKKQKFLRFVDCYNSIVELNAPSHTQWNDSFLEVIEKKLSINESRSNINTYRYGKEAWVKKIKEHLDS